MEVEFLSNMRYSLLASEKQWAEWQKKLGRFWLYCDKAKKAARMQFSPQALSQPKPTLPSPPYSHHPSPPSGASPYLPTHSANSAPNYSRPELQLQPSSRKRSFDGDAEEPASKRISRTPAALTPFPALSQIGRNQSPAPRLPVPKLTIPVNVPMGGNPYMGSNTSHQNLPLLPPLGTRAMATALTPTTQSWTPQLSMPTSTSQPGQHQNLQTSSGYSTPTRRHSPLQELLSYGSSSSPLSATFPSHNPGYISPNVFPHRSSPYKPIRYVNTLLHPPPSASMHPYSININQMQYQPLGKRTDPRTGVVPDYAMHSYHQWANTPRQ